jgi:hypothetical protein
MAARVNAELWQTVLASTWVSSVTDLLSTDWNPAASIRKLDRFRYLGQTFIASPHAHSSSSLTRKGTGYHPTFVEYKQTGTNEPLCC